jgi:hypothetical protein
VPTGFGFSPLGSSVYGFGSVDTASAPASSFYIDPGTGQPADTRLLDSRLRSYRFDANGSMLGMRSVYQLVQLAVQTVQGSSILQNFGNASNKIQTIDQTTQRRLEDAYRNALAPLVTNKQIAINSVTINQFKTDGVLGLLQFTDLTTGPNGTQQALTL